MGVKWLSRDIAYTGPCLCLCTTQEMFDEVCKEQNIPQCLFIEKESSGGTMHWYEDHCDSIAIVCIRPQEKSKELIAFGLIVHEATHVWQHYAEDICEHLPGKEQEAYAIQAISQTLMIEYRKQMRELKKCIAKSAGIPLPSLIPVT